MFSTKFQIERTTSLMKRSRLFAQSAAMFALASALVALPNVASATVITGTVFLGNASVLVIGNGGPGSCIDFYTSGSPTTCATTPAVIPVTSYVQSGSSSNFTPGQNGTIQDLNSGTTALTDFITVNNLGAPFYMFDLVDIRVNTNPANAVGCTTNSTVAGDTCQPVGSPFQFINGNTVGGIPSNTVGVTLTFDAEGYSGTSASGETPYTGVFTTQLPGNIQSVLNTVGTPGGFETSSMSLELFPGTATPEPATFGSIGAGLLCLSFLIRKRISKLS